MASALGLHSFDHLARKVEVGLRATGTAVVYDAWHAMAGRLGQADVAGYYRREYLVAKVLFELPRHLLLQHDTRIEHHTQQADDGQV